jgi:L-alanine-DL-glutamate epimerase-like enolase superfamily enzyme
MSEQPVVAPPGATGRDLGTVEAIETVRWKAQPNLLWARVRTSEGVVGLGETYYLSGAVESVIHDLAADLFIGEPAGAISNLWSTFFSCTNFFGFAGAEMRALSALDMALWDALGQASGLPVYQLLGGACRGPVPAYNTCVNAGPNRDWDRALDEPGDLAAELRDLGYLGMKVWPWDRFAPQIKARGSTGPAGWSSMGPMGSYLSLTDLATGLSMLETARDRVGPSFELLVEGHSRWDMNMALRICRSLEPIGVMWVEDICQPDSAEDLARLVRETRVPQAVSERLISRFAYREVLRQQAAHILLVDLAWTGGLTEARRVAELAAAYHLPFAPHDCTGPVTALANLHLATSQPNCLGVEVVRGFVNGYYREVLDKPFDVDHGHLVAPAGPGLGAALAEEFLNRSDVEVRCSK